MIKMTFLAEQKPCKKGINMGQRKEDLDAAVIFNDLCKLICYQMQQ